MTCTTQALTGLGVDCASTGHPLAWYQALKAQGYPIVCLDCMTPGWEADFTNALQAGLGVMLFQGYYQPAWKDQAAAQNRAQQAVQAAQRVGYPHGALVWLDFEAFTGPSESAVTWINTWAQTVTQAGYGAGLYVGMPQPLNSLTLYEALPAIHRYWRGSTSAAAVATRGYCGAQQQWNATLNGVAVDISQWTADALGGVAVGAVAVAETAQLQAQIATLQQQLTIAQNKIAAAQKALS